MTDLSKLVLGRMRGEATANPATLATASPSPAAGVAYVARVAVAASPLDAVKDMSLTDFARSGLVLEVESSVLGEWVLFVCDSYRTAPDDPVAYCAAELVALADKPPEAVRAAHAVKKAFPGATVAIGSRPRGEPWTAVEEV